MFATSVVMHLTLGGYDSTLVDGQEKHNLQDLE